MAKIFESFFNEIEKRLRFDVEYYEPVFIQAKEDLNRVPSIRLGKILLEIKTSAFYGPISFHYGKERGIPFVRVSDIEEPFLNIKGLVYLPADVIKNEKGLSSVTNEYLLISKGGTTGNLCFIPPNIQEVCISRDIVGIKINEEKIRRFFLLIFLITKYGKTQLLRGISRQTLSHLTLDVIRDILIPQFEENFQLHIEQLVTQAYEKRKLAEQKYQQAEKLFYQLLEINREEIKRLEAEKAYEINFNEIKKAFRLDAEHYHPKYYLLDKVFKNLTYVRLGDSKFFELKKGIEVGSDAYCDKNKGVLFLRVSNLSKDGLKINPSDKYIFKEVYEKLKSKYEPKEGEVLVSKDGTIGTAIAVTHDFLPTIISGGIVRIHIKNYFDPYYLTFILNSIITEFQVTREKTGTVIEHLRLSKLKELKIPMLSPDKQQEIATLVREYFNLRKEAQQLIQRAVKEVEEKIENALVTNRE